MTIIVEQWSRHFKPTECKNINLQVTELRNKKQPTSLKPVFK